MDIGNSHESCVCLTDVVLLIQFSAEQRGEHVAVCDIAHDLISGEERLWST